LFVIATTLMLWCFDCLTVQLHQSAKQCAILCLVLATRKKRDCPI
jgi:hypothetical protein